jgi:ribosome-associated protein
MTLVRHPRVDPLEVEFAAVRSQGAGGQNVNKVSSAAHLRFDVRASSLPEDVKQRLLALQDHRLTADGVVVIKAQEHRSLAMNREAALARLQALVDQVAELLMEDQSARTQPPTLLYTPEGSLSMAQRIVTLVEEAKG